MIVDDGARYLASLAHASPVANKEPAARAVGVDLGVALPSVD
jgi:hypothetical protein